jgi:hypothetical protein
MRKDKKKSKWQDRRERDAERDSQFDPKIHELGRQGYGFQMKRGYKPKPEELSGRNLPFNIDKNKDK